VGLVGLGCSSFFTVATILTTNKFATLLFLGLVYAGITLQQTLVATVSVDIGGKHVGAVLGAMNTAGSIGGFLFSVSFGYFVKWFGSYDLALIPVALMLALGMLLWFRIDATEELIPEPPPLAVPETAVPVFS